jgi:hypothetical protein
MGNLFVYGVTNWLPTKVTHEVQSPIRIVDGEAKVCALIDENTRWWNIPIVEAVFYVEEASIICGLPICPNSQVDKMVWAGSCQEWKIYCSECISCCKGDW